MKSLRQLNPELYRRWKAMRGRCHNPNRPDYKHYGARGIGVAPEWDRFEVFYKDMGPTFSKKLELDRKNNDAGYSKENCRWATRGEQVNNTRRCHLITIGEKTLNISQWAREVGVPRSRIKDRIRWGWPPRLAVLEKKRFVRGRDEAGRYLLGS